MNAKAKTVSNYQAKNSFGINKIRKIQRHLKKLAKKGFTDPQAEQALANTTTASQPTRKAPKEKLGWMSKNKQLGETIKSKFVGTVTKEAAMSYSRLLKLISVIPFRLFPTLVTNDKNEVSLVFKHTKGFNNFKGKIRPKTVALKALTA